MTTRRLSWPAAVTVLVSFVLLAGTRNHATADDLPRSSLTSGPAVHDLRLNLDAAAVQSLREFPRRYVHGRVSVDGEVFADVGIHLKGSIGSFRPLDDKPGLTVDLDRFKPGVKFRDVTKFHLNNSVEDPSYLSEFVGGQLFRAAGFPAPAVSHAIMWLNGRRLGLYVLKEGFTEEFRRRNFGPGNGALFEPEAGQDVDGRMQLKGDGREKIPAETALLRNLAAAVQTPDLDSRWRQLETALDVDQFVTFMAMEVLLAHRDGYTVARNNYRLHVDRTTGRVVFLPHGLDQLFEPADLPWKPHPAGLVARALLEIPEGRRRYEERFTALSGQLLQVNALTNQVNQTVNHLSPYLTGTEAADLRREAAGLCARITRRTAEVQRQLANRPTLPEFSSGTALLTHWTARDIPAGGRLVADTDPDGTQALRIVAGPVTSASWRTTLRLAPGRYRFEGRVRTLAVAPLDFGQNQGAAVRVTGDRPRSIGLTGDSPWQPIAVEFAVEVPEEEVQILCELRARAGEAWFDTQSLHLAKLE